MAEGDANATEPHPEKRLGVTADVQDAETLICPMKAALLKWALGRIKMRGTRNDHVERNQGDAPSSYELRIVGPSHTSSAAAASLTLALIRSMPFSACADVTHPLPAAKQLAITFGSLFGPMTRFM